MAPLLEKNIYYCDSVFFLSLSRKLRSAFWRMVSWAIVHSRALKMPFLLLPKITERCLCLYKFNLYTQHRVAAQGWFLFLDPTLHTYEICNNKRALQKCFNMRNERSIFWWISAFFPSTFLYNQHNILLAYSTLHLSNLENTTGGQLFNKFK